MECNMIFIYPIDFKYKAEMIAAQRSDYECLYYDHQEIFSGKPEQMFKNVPAFDVLKIGILRSYVMPPVAYSTIYTYLLQEKNIQLIDTPDQHLEVCSVVNHYDTIKLLCPQTSWIRGEDCDDEQSLKQVLKMFGAEGKTLMLKDYMRSVKYKRQKPYDIEDSTNLEQVKEAIQHFKYHSKGVINGGFVFSEYISDLKKIHQEPFPLTNQPMYEEYRLLFFKQELLMVVNYWEEMPDYSDRLEKDELQPFLEVAKRIDSNFFTMDIARRQDSSLVLIELNPAQLSGIDYKRHHEFYSLFKKRIDHNINYKQIKRSTVV